MTTNQSAARTETDNGTAGVPEPAQLRTILIAVCVALMAVISSVSGLNVAQPDLAVDLGASQGAVLWMINLYTLTLAALLLPVGALGDRVGRKRMLVAGLGVFGLASAMAGLAPSTEVMLAARLLSGVGAAMIMPITLAVITSTFPEEKRGQAIGVWTGVAGGGGILGMFLSAALVDVATWRWLFVLPIALVVFALVLTLRSVPDSREIPAHSFDTAGALASVVAVVGLIVTLQEGPERGWSDPVPVISLVIGVLAAVCFAIWERRRRDAALLDVRLFRERGLTSGSVTLLAVFGVQAGIFVVLFPFLQAVLGWSGLRSTLALMPGRRHGSVDDPFHGSHHQLPAARAPGRRIGAQRRHPRVRHRARRCPARRAAHGRLSKRHRRRTHRRALGRRRRRTGRRRHRRRGGRRRGRPGTGTRAGRAAGLRRRLAAGHVDRSRRHGRPVRLRPPSGPEDACPRTRTPLGGRPGRHRPLIPQQRGDGRGGARGTRDPPNAPCWFG
ncbi:MFS transporter [Modestobacter sp. SSW1-42]|uniref:MFS transporter n=1 Tax=Modestobacter sp. SSW1-42 TaxID=596372 RepID=UPI0039865EA3